jgi:hypothetical protein
VLRRIFVPKRKWREAGEDCIMRSFITCKFTKYYYGDKVKDEMGDMQHAWERCEVSPLF